MEIALAISILSVVITVSNFVLNRKDKAVKDASENSKALIDFRLTQVEKKLDKILDILDTYDKEIDLRVEKALKNHVLYYHGKEGK